MRIQEFRRQGCVVLILWGRLDLAAAPHLQRAIRKQLAEQPRAVICDLSQVEAIDPMCAGVFTSVRHPALSWPATTLLLCGTQPAVADTLLQQRAATRLAMYPSLDLALANAHARPPWLREQLRLGPVPTAARDGRAFVRQVCGRWGVQALADPVALLASELVSLAVPAGTALELRVELIGSRLHVAVRHQNRDLLEMLVAKEDTDRSLSLLILDQLATAWGVRQDEAGGTTAWCTLELPPQQAATGLPGPELMVSKLAAPATRAGLISRAHLQALLQAGLMAKLCLLDAPAGSGKTTLLAQWRRDAGDDPVAWVSLDDGDNDPTQFWMHVIEALRTVEPRVGSVARHALRGAPTDLDQMVLPPLLNDLNAVGAPIVLVLDDYHLITEARCHQTFGFFLDHLPSRLHVVLATRVDPPLPLARMRARGELAELRAADFQFIDEEAAALLNGAMGLRLSAEDVELLVDRTEGWAAGLYLAGLSLRGREDPSAFIAAFHGDHRHVADYLGTELLQRQPQEIREFLLRSSVLERLSGPLCDAVLETQGSAGLLRKLERSNLFLVPLDDRCEWYRYHQLFAELLRLELRSREPALVAILHQRAAAWHQAAGNIDEAIGHATAVGDVGLAGALIARHWLRYWHGGRRATVTRWLEGLPGQAIQADPSLALVAAWIGGFDGASKQQVERWLAATEDQSWQGPLPDGISSLAFGAALTRASALFDDVGRALQGARRALELSGSDPSPNRWMAQAALGHALYLSGRSAEARPPLEELARQGSPAAQPFAVMTALAVLSLLAGDEDDGPTAEPLARHAAEVAEGQGLSGEPLTGIVWMALGRALTRRGHLAEAEEQLRRALTLYQIDGMAVLRGHSLLLLALVRHGRGEFAGARKLVDEARELAGRCTDPGMLPSLLEQVTRALSIAPGRQAQIAAPLTERELAVLRLLATQLSTREIARELSVSVNTIRSQVQAIYRKLVATSRAEAVTSARQLKLLR